jgi:hypothetical protein
MKNLWLHGFYLTVIGILGFQLWARTATMKLAFEQVNSVLKNSNNVLKRESEYIYENILKNVASNPMQYEKFHYKGKVIKSVCNLATNLINLDQLKIKQFDKKGIKMLRDSLEILSHNLISNAENYDSLHLIERCGIVKLIQNDTFWESINVSKTTHLQLLKNQFQLDEILYLNYISDKMSAYEFRCMWRYKVAIAPRKSVLIEGEKFEADIFIVNYPYLGGLISYTVDTQKLPVENGIASFSKMETTTGLKTYKAQAIVRNPATGESTSSSTEFEYHVLPKCSQNCQ